MLSVKRVLASGHEDIAQARRVSYQPAKANGTDAPETVFVEDENGNTQGFIEGTVYVMNDAGSTVSKYSLVAPPPA